MNMINKIGFHGRKIIKRIELSIANNNSDTLAHRVLNFATHSLYQFESIQIEERGTRKRLTNVFKPLNKVPPLLVSMKLLLTIVIKLMKIMVKISFGVLKNL